MKQLSPRRAALTLGLVFLLLLALAVPAAAVKPADPAKLQRLSWYEVAGGSSDNVLTGSPVRGHVTINTPAGRLAMILNGRIVLAPNSTYGLWVRELTGYTGDCLVSYPPLHYCKLATFTTNGQGIGKFHLNLGRADLADATRNIQIAINTSAGDADIGSTVAATVKYTPVTTGR